MKLINNVINQLNNNLNLENPERQLRSRSEKISYQSQFREKEIKSKNFQTQQKDSSINLTTADIENLSKSIVCKLPLASYIFLSIDRFSRF